LANAPSGVIGLPNRVFSTEACLPSTLWIDVRYTVRSTNDRRNLVFPFYVIPDEPKAIPNHQTSTNPLLNRA